MLALMGCKVLVVDMDPQGHSTYTFGYAPGQRMRTMYDVLKGTCQLQDVIVQTYCNPGLRAFFDPRQKSNPADPRSPTLLEELGDQVMYGPDLAPINIRANEPDIKQDEAGRWKLLLRHALNGQVISRPDQAPKSARERYDYIIIDTNPSLGFYTQNALYASDYVCIPVNPEILAVQGLVDLLGAVHQAQEGTQPDRQRAEPEPPVKNPDLKVAGVLFTKVRNIVAHWDIIGPLRENKALHCFQIEIAESADFLTAANKRSVMVIDEALGEHALSYWGFLNELLAVIGGSGQLAIAATLRSLSLQRNRLASEKVSRREEKQRAKALAAAQTATIGPNTKGS
jgi:chromosome partitioning protein